MIYSQILFRKIKQYILLIKQFLKNHKKNYPNLKNKILINVSIMHYKLYFVQDKHF